jgi:hypothetical protein
MLLVGKLAAAQGEYPKQVQQNFQMGECLPGCGLCHKDPRGGGERNAWGNMRGTSAARASDAPVFDEDSDGDGTSDRDELKVGSNPGNGMSTPATVATSSVCLPAGVEMPTYGCGARIAPAPPAGANGTAGAAGLLAGILVFVGLRRRAART